MPLYVLRLYCLPTNQTSHVVSAVVVALSDATKLLLVCSWDCLLPCKHPENVSQISTHCGIEAIGRTPTKFKFQLLLNREQKLGSWKLQEPCVAHISMDVFRKPMNSR